MKIALISARRDPFLSPCDVDGGCVILRNYIKELYNLGHELHVFTRLETEDKEELVHKSKLQKEAGIGKVRIKNRLFSYRIPYEICKSKDGDAGQIVEAKSFSKNLEFYFEDEKFDVYHYFHLFSISGWLSRGEKIPHVKKSFFSPLLPTFGRTFENSLKERLFLEKRVCEEIEKVVCLSQREIDIIVGIYNISENKVLKIPLGIDRMIFTPKNNFNKFDEDNKLLIVSPNAIREQKKQLEVIKSVHKLKQRGVKVSALIIGQVRDKEYFLRLNKEIETLKLSSITAPVKFDRDFLINCGADIVFANEMDQVKLANVIRMCDISLFPSLDETFGLILLESMSCGTPPVCFLLKAYEDYLIPYENAIAVSEKRGSLGLVEEIEELVKNKEKLKMLSKTAVNTASRFSWTNLLNQQLYAYSQALDAKEKIYSEYFSFSNWINLHK
jgi:glycosyltransferase involved in cell wall biosynthesis